MSGPTKHGISITFPDGKVRRFLLGAKKITIGRGKENDIVISDNAVSTRHCELRKKGANGASYELIDLESTNGTHLNGEEVGSDDARELRNDDQFRIGLEIEAQYFSLTEIGAKSEKSETPPLSAVAGAVTQRLREIHQERKEDEVPPDRDVAPSINPVAAAVARAERGD